MFKAWPKIPRLENEVYHITEKIDGTNAAIIVQAKTAENKLPTPMPILETTSHYIWAQSRTRLITPEDDNFGFAKWVKENAEQLIKDLGEGYHFGEWWGQGIQRGYDLDHKQFSLFNPTKQSSICCNIPILIGDFEDWDTWPLSLKIAYLREQLKLNGSFVAPGYMRPEGLVIYAEKAKCYWKVIIDK